MADISITGFAFTKPSFGADIRVPRRMVALWRLYRLRRHSRRLLAVLGEADSRVLHDVGANPALRSRQDWMSRLNGR